MRGEPIRAAVISDTHGLLRPEVEQIIQSCDVVIHAGDFDSQMLYHKLNIKQPLYGVRGNNDGYWAEHLPQIRRFSLEGVSFLVVHDQGDVPSQLQDVQVVIFGHSHMYYQQERDGRLWLNPGSCGHRRFHLPLSMAVLTIEDGQVFAEPVWLDEEMEKTQAAKDGGGAGAAGNGKGAGATGNGRGAGAAGSGRGAGAAGNGGDAGAAGSGRGAGAAGNGKGAGAAEDGRSTAARAAREALPPETGRAGMEEGSLRQTVKEHLSQLRDKNKDQLFLIAKIMRFVKRGDPADWVAQNLKAEPEFVEQIYRIVLTHPGVDARQVMDKLEVNQLYQKMKGIKE